MTITTDGGIKMPSVPPAAIAPPTSDGEYPRLSRSTPATRDIVAVVAREDPDTAPSAAEAAMVAIASDPRARPNRAVDAENSRSVIPDCTASAPISTKSGMTEKVYSVPICNAVVPKVYQTPKGDEMNR